MGVKKVETRSWQTQYRGNILIHASQGRSGSIFATELSFKKNFSDFKKLPFGAIIGVATLTEIIRVEELFLNDYEMNKLTMEEKAFGDYSSGRYAWILKNPIAFAKPIPARGMLSLWEYELNLI